MNRLLTFSKSDFVDGSLDDPPLHWHLVESQPGAWVRRERPKGSAQDYGQSDVVSEVR